MLASQHLTPARLRVPCVQAIARLFRYGQTQETYVYRLYWNGDMQYNIYLQVGKSWGRRLSGKGC